MLNEIITILQIEDNASDAGLVKELLQEVEAFQFKLIHISRLTEALTYLRAKKSITIALEKQERDHLQHSTPISVNGAASLPVSHSWMSCCKNAMPQGTKFWIVDTRQEQHKTVPALTCPQVSEESAALSVILLNLSGFEAQGLDTLKQVHLAASGIPIIVMSDSSDQAIAVEVLQHGAQDYLVKDHVDGNRLVSSIRYAIERQRMQQRIQQLTEEKIGLQAITNRQQHLLSGVADAMRQLLITTDYQEAMRRSLTVLGIATDVDRVCIFENHFDEKTGEPLTYERFKWAQDQVSVQDNPKLHNLFYKVFLSHWYNSLAVGQPVKGLVRDFPQKEREILEQENICSILVVPVITEGKFWGFISFADCKSDRQWTDHEESILTVIAGSIGSIIVRQQTEQALRESETKFRTLYKSTSAAVILLNENGIFDANSAALEMFGCTEREQICGNRGEYQSFSEESRGAREKGSVFRSAFDQIDNSITPPPSYPFGFSPPVQPNGQDSLSLANQYIATAIQEGSCRFDWIYSKRNGKEFPAEVTLTLIELGNRQVLQAVIHDIAERKATETQLLMAKEAAEAGSRAKSEFLATMSHELRTPLNAVLGLSQLMRQELFGTLNQKQKEYIACIQSSGEHLLALINDILDLSKVEAGKEQLSFVPLDIRELCEYCLAMVREQAYDQGLKLTLDIDPQARVCIADERRCKQMLLNLLSNAVKFTPSGEVSLIVRKPFGSEAGRDRHSWMQHSEYHVPGIAFTVKDTGIGIASEQLLLLFEPFRQLDSGLNRRFPGTGLGLALTRSLAKLHGGDVSVESTLGKGSEFTLWLSDWPSQELLLGSSPQELGECEGQSCPLGTKSRILLIENDERSALVLKDYLQIIGHNVQHLTHGTNFLETVRSFKPNLILMDVHLPGGCTGFDLLAALRQAPDTKPLKVVMVTAMAMAGDRERCLEAGADDYLSKPIGIAQLEAILMRYL